MKKFNANKKVSKKKTIATLGIGVVLGGLMLGETQVTNAPKTIDNHVDFVIPPQVSGNEHGEMMESGLYEVGVDIEPGVYYVKADYNLGYVASLTNSTRDLDSIIQSETVNYHTFIEVRNGEYLEVLGATFCKADDVAPIQYSNEGTYRVGVDLPSGVYKISPNENVHVSYVEIMNDVHGDLQSIVASDIINENIVVSLQDGQYIYLRGATIELN